MTAIQWISLFGGIGMFLYGMTQMSAGIRKACGSKLQRILEKATQNTGRGVLVGTAVTLLVQSSAATDVMVIGFVNSGLMTLAQAVSVIMGANIGTTVTAQITAFNLSTYAPLILFAGAVMVMFLKKGIAKHIGTFLLGFGLLFQGIGFMKSAIAPLAASPKFVSLVAELSNPFVLILVGIAMTALLQSSSSATVIIQAFAVEELISFPSAIYLIIGSAVGSVAPNFLAALATNRNGKRTAMLNLLFNLFRAAFVMLLVTLVPGTLSLIERLSPGDVARQVANAHTFFALLAVLVMLPFSKYLVSLTMKLMPLQEEELRQRDEFRLHYMANLSHFPPSVALHQAKKEISRMGRIASENLKTAVECFFHQDPQKAKKVGELETVMDYLNTAIISKLVELRASDMSQRDMDTVYHMTLTVSDMERISDLAENVAEHGMLLRKEHILLSDEAIQNLSEMADLCIESVELCTRIFDKEEFDRLDEAEALEEAVDNKQDEVISAHVRRLTHGSCNPLGGVIFTDMATELERCSDHALNIAYSLSRRSEKKDSSSVLTSIES